MNLSDFSFVALSDYIVGVEKDGETIMEFPSTDREQVKEYADYIVTGIFVLNEDTMAVTVSEPAE